MTYSLFAESGAADTPVGRRVADRLGTPAEIGTPHTDNSYYTAKKTIYLKNYKGDFLKLCPGTSRYTCCGYNFLNIATNCPIDCTYCILQDYLGPAALTIHCNLDDMLAELSGVLSGNKRFYRIGTGELTDSLAIDELTGYTRELVPFFGKFRNAVLELKTKTAFVENLTGLEHNGRTIAAWSLNPERIVEADEAGAAPLADRIRAARLCQDEGYRLAFHFDPIIEYPGWRDGYKEVMDMLFDSGIRAEAIAWISLGCLRFVPGMRKIIAERFPGSVVRTGEFINGIDGKMRYFKPIRIEMYRALVNMIQRGWPKVFVYLCMESKSVWEASLEWAPTGRGLAEALDKRGAG